MRYITHHASDFMRILNLSIVLASPVIVAMSFATSLAHGAHSCRWRWFHSAEGFVVRYPENWVRKGISKTRLTILSAPGGAEAVVIKRGQAEISVISAKEHKGASLAELIDSYSRSTTVLSRRRVRNTRPGVAGCKEFERIVSKEELVPAGAIPGTSPYIINTEFFCKIDAQRYVIALRNFQGDRRQLTYQHIAKRMAETLRYRQ